MRQWTVSMNKSDLCEGALHILERFEYVNYETKNAGTRIDMSEEEFFSFMDDCESEEIALPVDGSNSWSKMI